MAMVAHGGFGNVAAQHQRSKIFQRFLGREIKAAQLQRASPCAYFSR